MYRSAYNMLKSVFFDPALDQYPLIHKRCDDSNTFIRIFPRITHDLLHLCRRGILHVTWPAIHIDIDKRLSFPAVRLHLKFGVIIFFIVKVYDFFITAVMISQKYLIADRITGKICLINGIFAVIIFIRNMVFSAQFPVREFVQ